MKSMALLPLQSSFITTKPHPHLYKYISHNPTNKPKFTITSQDSSSSSPIEEPSSSSSPSKKPNSTGLGFGSSKPNPPGPEKGKKKNKGRRDRASVIRRTPVEKPAFLEKKGGDEEAIKEQSLNERAFLLTWLGLGGVIFLEGIALAASGFLPEQWDKFFVKFLYPSFTPTVFLFVAGTVAYGVLKYNENLKSQK